MGELVRREQAGQVIPEGTTDAQAVELWLQTGRRRSEHTRRAYRADAGAFRGFVGKPLAQVTLQDALAYRDSLTGSDATKLRRMAAVKSLLGTLHRFGFLPFDVGAAVELPPARNTLAERILSEEQVLRMIALEPDARNRTLLRLLYASGARVSELCGLRWQDCAERKDGGQVSLFGKGNKTRAVLLSAGTWGELQALRRDDCKPGDSVFRSERSDGPLDQTRVWRIVAAAASRAGIEGKVSPHWLRHAHGSHALDRGAPISVVQATLGHSNVATTSRYLHARPTDSSALYLPVA